MSVPKDFLRRSSPNFFFLHLAAWNVDAMAGAPAASMDHEYKDYGKDSRAVRWTSLDP